MSQYGGITSMNAVFTPGQADRVARYLPYRNHVMVGGVTLTRGCAFTQGVPFSLILHAPAAPICTYVTLPSLFPPLPIGSGVPTNAGGEFRLGTNDPLLIAALNSPSLFGITGIIGQTDLVGAAPTSVILPSVPSLVGLVLYWQSMVALPSGFDSNQRLPATIR